MALFTYIILLGLLNITFAKDCVIDNTPERISQEIQLKKDLKCNYRFFDPPYTNSTEPLPIKLNFILKYFNFNSKEAAFSIQTWVFLSWTDSRLKWDPDKYSGIESTTLSSISIWTPVFLLYNSADSNDFDRYIYTYCRVNYTGRVTCNPRLIHTVVCVVNLKKWPYDQQECSLVFGVETSKWYKMKLNFTSDAISMFGAEYGADWYISDYRQEENDTSERQLKMTFVLVREADALAAIVIYPAIILTALSITCLFLDVRYKTRLGFACFSLVCHYYFLQNLAMKIPTESAQPPLILLYYRGSNIVTLIIIFITLALTKICKLKSTPQNYIISINDFVYKSYGKYFLLSFWEFDEAMSKEFAEDWTKFANVLNSGFIYVIVITYIAMYGSLVPQPIPITYN